jgi:hypothetical protein
MGKPQDTARELIMAALDFPEVESSLLRSACQRAFRSVRDDFQQLVGAQVAELNAEWQRRQHEAGVPDERWSGE